MSAPQTMTARRERIRALLDSRHIESQAQLRLILAGEGIEVTQATLSRDLDALGALKRTTADGTIRYAVNSPFVVTHIAQADGIDPRIVAEVLVAADCAQNIAVLRTPPGAAMYLAGTLDRSGAFGLLGTVAGDDTVLVVLPSDREARDLCAHLVSLAEGRTAPARSPSRRRSS